jgi:ribosomal protein S21
MVVGVQGEVGDSFLEIKVNENNVDGALKVLKRKLQKEGLFREIKRRKSYEKPSNDCGGGDENTY